MGAGLFLQEFPKLLLFFWLAVLCFIAGAGHGKLSWRLLITSAAATAAGGIGLAAGTFIPMLVFWLAGKESESGQTLLCVSIGTCVVTFVIVFGVALRRLVWLRRPEFERSKPKPAVYVAGVGLLVYLGYLIYSATWAAY